MSDYGKQSNKTEHEYPSPAVKPNLEILLMNIEMLLSEAHTGVESRVDFRQHLQQHMNMRREYFRELAADSVASVVVRFTVEDVLRLYDREIISMRDVRKYFGFPEESDEKVVPIEDIGLSTKLLQPEELGGMFRDNLVDRSAVTAYLVKYYGFEPTEIETQIPTVEKM